MYSRLEPPPPSPPTSRDRSASVKERMQSIEEHLTASTDESDDNQRSKLLSKMSRLGGQAILPPGTMPTAQVRERKREGETSSLCVYVLCYILDYRRRGTSSVWTGLISAR